jgi:hypothetical protein
VIETSPPEGHLLPEEEEAESMIVDMARRHPVRTRPAATAVRAVVLRLPKRSRTLASSLLSSGLIRVSEELLVLQARVTARSSST